MSDQLNEHNNVPNVPKVVAFLSMSKSSLIQILHSYVSVYAVFLGAMPSVISILVSTRNLIQFGGQASFGKLSDKYSRRLVFQIGFFLTGLFGLTFIFIPNVLWIVVGGMGLWLALSAIQPAYESLIGDYTTNENRNKIYGRLASLGSIATLIIALFLAWFVDWPQFSENPYAMVFLFITIISLLSIIFTLFLPKKTSNINMRQEKFSNWLPLKHRAFKKFIIIEGGFYFSMSLGWPFFPFVEEKLATPGQIQLLWVGFIIASIFGFIFAHKIIKRLGTHSLFYARLPMFLVPFVFAFATSWIHLTLVRTIAGFCFSVYLTSRISYIIKLCPVELKGTYIGLISLITGLLTFLGSMISGLAGDVLFNIYGQWEILPYIFLVIASLRLLFSFLYLFVEKNPTISIYKNGKLIFK